MVDLSGRTILVAGGTGNVGRHLVRAQLEAGATVVVPSRSAGRARELADWLGEDGGPRLQTVVADLTDADEAGRVLETYGPVHGAVASLGGFVAAPSVLEAPPSDLRRALEGYVVAHFAVARNVIPALAAGSGYVMINGPLAFDPRFPGTGLVSVATAAQAMLARVLFAETAERGVRVNEVVLYSSFGWGRDDDNEIDGSDIGTYVARLLSDAGAGVRGESLHLKSRDRLAGRWG